MSGLGWQRRLWLPLGLAVGLVIPAVFAGSDWVRTVANIGFVGAALWFFDWFMNPGRPFTEWLAEGFFLRAGLPRVEAALMAGAMAAIIGVTILTDMWWMVPLLLMVPGADAKGMLRGPGERTAFLTLISLVIGAGILTIMATEDGPLPRWPLGLGILAFWLCGWATVEAISRIGEGRRRAARAFGAVWLGAVVLTAWELVTQGFGVPQVILPAPSDIWTTLISSVPTLWADFVQTVLKSVVPGYAMGCGAAFLVAIATDRSPFLQRGLLPIGNLAAALPIVGIAPIMVMWFGFDWHSKAAVVVIMCFFPMLVNTMQGLASAERMQRDLMHTYAASYWQTLFKLRLPAAAPFIFNGLKICTTLALIGAIVAEFFGTPIVGMGFRISTEIGRMALDMVWAEIAVAALAGSAFYGLVALAERWATFWHPSVRG